MKHNARLFLDTSALFAGIWSAQGGARMLLKLGEAGVVQLLVSAQVLEELETVIRRKAEGLLPNLALLLDRSQVQVLQTIAPFAAERHFYLAGGTALTIFLRHRHSLALDWFTS